MTRRIRFGHPYLVSTILVSAMLGTAAPAQVTGPAMVAPPPAADAPQVERAAYWTGRAAPLHARIQDARTRLDDANAAVTRMRRRNHPRGDARDVIREEQTQAQAAYDAAVRALEVDLTNEARAADAQLRWLREES